MKAYNITKLLCLYILICLTQAYGQNYINRYIQLDTILAYPDLTSHTHYVYTQHNNFIYIAKRYNTSSDSVELIITNTDNYHIERYTINIPYLNNYINPIYNMRITHITACNHSVVLQVFNRYYLIKKTNNGWTHVKTINISANARNDIFLINDSIMIGGHIYHPHDTATSLYIYNWNTEKIEQFIEPGNYHTAFSYINGVNVKQIDVAGRFIAWADRNRYTIHIYDSQTLDTICTFRQNIKGWKYFNENKLNTQLNKHNIHDAIELIEIAESALDQSHQIRYVKFITPHKILVAYQGPTLQFKKGIPEVYIDIWEESNGQWKLTEKKDITDIFKTQLPSQNSTYNKHCYGICFVSNTQLFFYENKLAVFYKDGTTCYPIGKTLQEYADCYNEYMLHHSPCLEIRFFNHEF